jgi:hypothetical protein
MIGHRSNATNGQDSAGVVPEHANAKSLNRHPRAFLPTGEHFEMIALDLVAPGECLAEKDYIGCLVGEQRRVRTGVSRVHAARN